MPSCARDCLLLRFPSSNFALLVQRRRRTWRTNFVLFLPDFMAAEAPAFPSADSTPPKSPPHTPRAAAAIELAHHNAASGLEDTTSRYLYALRLTSRLQATDPADNAVFYLAKVGITTSAGIGALLRRFYDHRNSVNAELLMPLQVPFST